MSSVDQPSGRERQDQPSGRERQAGPTTVVSFDEVPALVGKHLGRSGWHEIHQKRINQWIHVDPERARSGPFGVPVAHGFLTLSMSTALLWEILRVDGAGLIVNYGQGKTRFPGPVPVGSRIRLSADCATVAEVGGGGYQATFALTFEREGEQKPVCVTEVVFRYYPGGDS